MANPLLRITDGTTYVSLIDPKIGFFLRGWRPAISVLKDGGVWHSSPYTDGRRLVQAARDSVDEAFTLGLQDLTQDDVASRLVNLRRLLDKARAYWTDDFQPDVVWIEARGGNETNTRYAVVLNWSMTSESNPFSSPLFGCRSTMDEFDLMITRGHWQADTPGTDTCLNITAGILAEEKYGLEFGYTSSTPNVYCGYERLIPVANHHVHHNLHHIIRVDASGPTFLRFINQSSEVALPWTLLPSPAAIGDALCFGAELYSSPFTNLVFGLSQGMSGITVVWEYYNGAGWTTLDTRDNTNNMAQSGSIHWPLPSNMAYGQFSTFYAGAPTISAYWVRMRVSAITSPVSPIQANNEIFTCHWPYVDLDAGNVGGDIPAKARIQMRIRSSSVSASPILHSDKVRVALRSMERGEEFTPFINLTDTVIMDMNFGRWNVYDWTRGTTIESMAGQCGYSCRYTPTGPSVSGEGIMYAYVADGYEGQYKGKYRVFLRCRQNGGNAGDLGVNFYAGPAGAPGIYRSGWVYTKYADGRPHLLDLGLVDIPLTQGLALGDSYEAFGITFYGANLNTGSSPTLDLTDAIFWPVDEWTGEFTYNHEPGTLQKFERHYFHEIDSTLYPKEELRAFVKYTLTSSQQVNEAKAPALVSYSNRPFILPVNKKVRLWFLAEEQEAADGERDAAHEIYHTITLYRTDRFYGLRGAG